MPPVLVRVRFVFHGEVHEGEHLVGILLHAPSDAILRRLMDLGKHLSTFAKERSGTAVLLACRTCYEPVDIRKPERIHVSLSFAV